MNTQCKLPMELFRPILQQIQDSYTLTSACLASRILFHEAQMILYYDPSSFCMSHRVQKHIRLLTSLNISSRLARLVHTYQVLPSVGVRKTAIWILLRHVLPKLVNLKNLTLIGYHIDFEMLAMDKIICQLESLSWTQIDIQYSDVLPKWLATQYALKNLRWIYGRLPIKLSPTACPDLVTLEGSFEVVRALLPGRQIKRLYWLADPTLYMTQEVNGIISTLSTYLKNLKSLSVDASLSAIHYHDLSDYLDPVVLIEFNGGTDNVEDISEAVAALPTSQFLVISTQKGLGGGHFFTHERRATLVRNLFHKSSMLVRVDIAVPRTQEVDHDCYERWFQGRKLEELVNQQRIFEE